MPREQLVPLISGATVFVVPSAYEPSGIVDLEAAARGTAVVASDVGGIPEVVDDRRTGLLVHHDAEGPAGFAAGLARAWRSCWPTRPGPRRWGRRAGSGAGRVGWPAIAAQTLAVHRSVLAVRG